MAEIPIERKPRSRAGLVVLILILIVVAACGWWWWSNKTPTTLPATGMSSSAAMLALDNFSLPDGV